MAPAWWTRAARTRRRNSRSWCSSRCVRKTEELDRIGGADRGEDLGRERCQRVELVDDVARRGREERRTGADDDALGADELDQSTELGRRVGERVEPHGAHGIVG